ncbi:MAG: TrkA family potassium uptake protein, partial [Clostridiales bacterium]
AKFLLRNGADQVVYPEREIGEKLAVKYGCTNIFDYMELDLEYSIYEISTPASWVGKSIAEIQVRNKYQVSVLATKVDGHIQPLTKPEYVFCAREIVDYGT